jgi:hypothetical protein
LQTHSLVAHPAFAPGQVAKVAVRWGRVRDGRIMLRYRIDGGQGLVIPKLAPPLRTDQLWANTCCELFVSLGGGRYREYNFSPSGQWAAYNFAGYRTRSGDHDPLTMPEIAVDRGAEVFTLTVFLAADELAGAQRANLTAVLKEERDRRSFWALRHPGLNPDFHDPTCFVLPVP